MLPVPFVQCSFDGLFMTARSVLNIQKILLNLIVIRQYVCPFVCRISATLRQASFLKCEILGVRWTRKGHHGRDAFCFQLRSNFPKLDVDLPRRQSQFSDKVCPILST